VPPGEEVWHARSLIKIFSKVEAYISAQYAIITLGNGITLNKIIQFVSLLAFI
jgi:hypothetical protein